MEGAEPPAETRPLRTLQPGKRPAEQGERAEPRPPRLAHADRQGQAHVEAEAAAEGCL